MAELRTAMFLTGSATLADFSAGTPIILGETAAWLRQLDPARLI